MNSKKHLILVVFFLITSQFFAQNAKKYTTYVVKSGETIRSIAKKIDCKTKEIRNLNPDVDRKNPPVNTTLVVPNKNYGKPIIKELVEPKTVVIHIVEPKNTFYGIAKKYNVTIQSIKDANPIVANGLKTGQKLRIPSKSEYTVHPKKSKVEFYRVKKNDTKWHIATMYNITVAELNQMNPNLQGKLRENDTIWVPASNEIPEEIKDTYKQNQNPPYIYHVIKEGEGLFRIAVVYNTTQEEIRKLNPEATKKLRPGMLLKIPGEKPTGDFTHKIVKGDTFYNLTRRYGISKKELLSLNPELDEDLKIGMYIVIKPLPNQVSNTDSIPIFELNKLLLNDYNISLSKPIHLSFLMPLKTDLKVDYSSKKDSQLRTICTDFFMGAEMAIDSLKKLGLTINYHVYDTKNNLSQLYYLLKNEDLKNSDAIIGPFFFENTQKVAKKFPNIPVYAPLYSKKQSTDYTKNLIKSAVDKKEMLTVLTNYLLSNYKQQKIIIVTDTNKENINKAKKITHLLKQHDSISSITLIEPSRNKKRPKEIYMNKEKLQNSIEELKETWVILISDDEIVLSDTVNTYGVLSIEHNIRLFTPENFRSFKHLDYQYLGQLLWSFPAKQFDHLDTKAVAKFKREYYQLNHTYPSLEAFTGFDLTYDVIIRLASSEDYTTGLELGKSNRLSQQFNYVPKNGGYFNKSVLMIALNNDLEFNTLD